MHHRVSGAQSSAGLGAGLTGGWGLIWSNPRRVNLPHELPSDVAGWGPVEAGVVVVVAATVRTRGPLCCSSLSFPLPAPGARLLSNSRSPQQRPRGGTGVRGHVHDLHGPQHPGTAPPPEVLKPRQTAHGRAWREKHALRQGRHVYSTKMITLISITNSHKCSAPRQKKSMVQRPDGGFGIKNL
ncbi:hypothetical protein AALO_G00082180 [Alosa alosa]|uniref:Uncharacterized protein n=1 Tax=Alosa alosa TaxID=278164 RepID=A0AAV6GXS9_9TELE|nr:hypothetical protein AALO_G00082180 [Alosa alosa]